MAATNVQAFSGDVEISGETVLGTATYRKRRDWNRNALAYVYLGNVTTNNTTGIRLDVSLNSSGSGYQMFNFQITLQGNDASHAGGKLVYSVHGVNNSSILRAVDIGYVYVGSGGSYEYQLWLKDPTTDTTGNMDAYLNCQGYYNFDTGVSDVAQGGAAPTNFQDGTVGVLVDNSGNVGIGTTSPDGVLHIRNAIPAVILDDSDNDTKVRLVGGSGGDLYVDSNWGGSGNTGDIIFREASSEKMRIAGNGDVGIGTNAPVSGLTVSKDIESTNSFITERVLFKETWPNGYNSLIGDLGTWVVTNLNLQSNPTGGTTTPDGYTHMSFNGVPATNGEFVSPAFDLSDYAIVDGTLQAEDKRKTTTRVFMKFWFGTRQLDAGNEVAQVQFSPDNGSTWYTVATSQDRNSAARFTMVSADLSPYILETSTNAKIRVYMPWSVASGDYMRIGRIWIHESDVPTNLGGMWLGAGGNIGIGTTSPNKTLDIGFPDSGYPGIRFTHTDTGGISRKTSGYENYFSGLEAVIERYADKDVRYTGSNVPEVTHRINLGYSDSYNDNSGFYPKYHEMHFDVMNKTGEGDSTAVLSRIMTLRGDGRVGIGTTTPKGQLEVHGEGQTSFTEFNQSGNMGGTLTLRSDDGISGSGGAVMFGSNTGYHAAIKASLVDGSVNTRGHLGFFVRNDFNDATMSHAMTITDGGNVGIGTTNPVGVNGTGRLEGSSNGGFEYIATRSQSSIGDGSFIGAYLFKNDDTAGTTPHYAGMAGYGFGANGNMDLRFFAGRDVYEDTPLEPHMTIAKSGNVGIGTTNPSYTFDVADQNGNIDNPIVVFRANVEGASNGDGNVLRVENSGARTDAELYDATSNGVRQFSVKASGRCEAREFDVASLSAAGFLGGDGGSSDGIFSRPDGQVYISVDDDFYFRDNADTTATRRGYMDTDNGNFKVTGGFTSSASLDYSEYFEWYDGNPDNEDRIGYSVSLFPGTDMIKKCEEGETPIGIVSGTSGFTGGGADIYWKGYWEQDAWGRPVYAQQLIHGEPVFNEDGTPKMKRVVNPDWDSTSTYTYIPRKDRKEWACVGLLGQVLMRPECIHSPFWTKMKSIDSEKDLWLISLFPSINKDVENDLEVEKVKTATLETQLASVLARLDTLESA